MKELWDIKNWNYFKSYDLGYQIFGKAIHLSLDKENKLFNEKILNERLEGKWNNLNFANEESLIKIFGPDSIIVFFDRNLYLIPNEDFNIEFFGLDGINYTTQDFDNYLIKKSKNPIWIFLNINRDKIKNGYNNIIHLNKPLEEYKYKGRFYTFFLINWLKFNLKKIKWQKQHLN
jgi:hypothetical protein